MMLRGETDIDGATRANPCTPWIVAGAAAIAVGSAGSLALLAVASEPETTCSSLLRADSVLFSIVAEDWPAVREGLVARVKE